MNKFEPKEKKFKVWDGVDYMSNPFTLYDIVLRKIQFTSDYKVLEYTGRNDKNGIEIYEGSIVKRNALCFDDNYETYYEEQISFVSYHGHGFWFEGEHFGWEGEGLWDWDQVEVIGNTYENSDIYNALLIIK